MFAVRFVDEDSLPTDQAWVTGIDRNGRRFLFIKEGARSTVTLEEAWAAHMAALCTQRLSS